MASSDSLQRVTAGSRLGKLLARLVRGSRLAGALRQRVTLLDALTEAAQQWLATSLIVGIVLQGISRSQRFASAAAIGRFVTALGRWTRQSVLYRWLTAEPEPEVVVIDLRETLTVRPFLVALDETIGLLVVGRRTSVLESTGRALLERVQAAPVRIASVVLLAVVLVNLVVTAALGSLHPGGLWIRLGVAAVALAGTRVTSSWATIRQSRPAKLAIALLEPPEPPDGQTHERRPPTERAPERRRTQADRPRDDSGDRPTGNRDDRTDQ